MSIFNDSEEVSYSVFRNMNSVAHIGFVLSGIVCLLLLSSLHHVEEGNIGMYWFGGALLGSPFPILPPSHIIGLDSTHEPGYHFKYPFITRFANVQVTLQTDVVRDIPCGTSGGSVIYFDKIEVVNILDRKSAHQTIKQYGVDYDRTWIFDRIHHEISTLPPLPIHSPSIRSILLIAFSARSLHRQIRATR